MEEAAVKVSPPAAEMVPGLVTIKPPLELAIDNVLFEPVVATVPVALIVPLLLSAAVVPVILPVADTIDELSVEMAVVPVRFRAPVMLG